MTEALVRVETSDRVATLTLNRPDARNALSRALMDALWDAVTAADEDPGIDVIVLTGTDPAFCAGVDLTEAASGAMPPLRPPGEGPGRDANGLFRFLPAIAKPVIGAINGAAVTGGLELALQCTFLIASDRARFADTHARVGVMPGGGITVLLAATVGTRKAIELSLTGNFLTAPEALRLGLVNHVVPHDDLLTVAHGLARDIAGNDPLAVRTLLAHYKRLADTATLTEAHLLEGILAETWRPGTSDIAARRAAVIERGRSQVHADSAAAEPDTTMH
ncbi:enoyl-CoA hydratase [Nocardia macrotermitis]|uniref:Putative enoyl-CoA hydratase echA8 n=1 Tax=Nocardia macrotermitis TaxID=2585198 RepID=A0A7K0CZA8_9NOCA|nr:enoyl-CoA hydratase [Nocardia macrotermitis]MQY18770.1 putative enoyl-CoA hydratase echA8 [Nocardia macrotermitis]